MQPPIVGIAPDIYEATSGPATRISAPMTYQRAVIDAGATPVILTPEPERIDHYTTLCDAFIFIGGDDPTTEAFGEPTHPNAKPIHHLRQAFELALLDALEQHHHIPVLGICLGMQLMALRTGGHLNQFMPDNIPTAADHWNDAKHDIKPTTNERPFSGTVTSHHRQAIDDPGGMRVVATAPDGVIEAIDDPNRPYYLGVQWHPERTTEPKLGIDIIKELVNHAAHTPPGAAP